MPRNLPGKEVVSMGGRTTERTEWGGGALEQRHGASLEPLAECDDALSGVGAFCV